MISAAPLVSTLAAGPGPMATAIAVDPAASARSAQLRYVSDASPGIRRLRRGRGFSYLAPDGTAIRERAELARIRALAIPPAWNDVWICPTPRGHIQASGRDEKGRKQYRYHPRWREVRDDAKFDRMIAFGNALPRIHAVTSEHLALRGLPRQKVLATVTRLLETTLIRVGNEEYARTNDSYGMTTLRTRHVELDGSEISFDFRGKSGKSHRVSVRDRRVARVMRGLLDLPGQELFMYVDDAGEARAISSDDVNAYLNEITGEEFTAKDFRTWAGTVLCARALSELDAAHTDREARRNVSQAVKAVARQLGNTPAVCRASYIHPAVIDSYLDGALAEQLVERVADETGANGDLASDERALLAYLQRRLATGAAAPPPRRASRRSTPRRVAAT